MTRFAVCTALYEAGRPFLPAYLTGLRQAADGVDMHLVLAIDDMKDFDSLRGQFEDICPVTTVKAPQDATPARVRRCLLGEAIGAPADILIFADMDDVLAPAAPGLHRDALTGAEISFGDMNMIDAEGENLRRRFFAGAGVPWQVQGAGSLLDRNFLGLSNTAVRREALPDQVLSVPDDIVAVDWWLFTTMLLAGRRAQRIPEAVSDYRIYVSNTLGAGAPQTRDELRQFLDIACRHYRAFPGSAMHLMRGARVEALADRVSGLTAHELAVALSASGRRSGVWFEFLNHMMVPAEAGSAARAAI